MESYFDILLAATLNVYAGDWNIGTTYEKVSLYAAAFFLILTTAVIVFFAIFFVFNFGAFRYKDFIGKFGTVVEGTQFDTPQTLSTSFGWVFFFFLRRIAFVYSVIFQESFIWA